MVAHDMFTVAQPRATCQTTDVGFRLSPLATPTSKQLLSTSPLKETDTWTVLFAQCDKPHRLMSRVHFNKLDMLTDRSAINEEDSGTWDASAAIRPPPCSQRLWFSDLYERHIYSRHCDYTQVLAKISWLHMSQSCKDRLYFTTHIHTYTHRVYTLLTSAHTLTEFAYVSLHVFTSSVSNIFYCLEHSTVESSLTRNCRSKVPHRRFFEKLHHSFGTWPPSPYGHHSPVGHSFGLCRPSIVLDPPSSIAITSSNPYGCSLASASTEDWFGTLCQDCSSRLGWRSHGLR